MKIIDSKGRLFGKINILDLGAIAVIVLVLIGIFIVPGPSGSVAQVGTTANETIELNVLVRGLSVKNAPQFLESLKGSDVNIIVRNEPSGKLTIESLEELPNYVIASQPDGSVKALLDPRPIVAYSIDMLMLATGKGQMTKDGAVLANQKIKIGTVLELDAPTYNFRASVIGVNKRS